MNKLISIKQIKKNADIFEDDEEYQDEDDESYSELALGETFDFMNKLNNIAITDKKCKNEKCIGIAKEIEKLSEECLNLEKKCILVDYMRHEQLFEISERLSNISKQVDKMIGVVETYEGESLDNLSYDELAKIELSLLKLLQKVRTRIYKIEYNILKGKIKNPEEDITKCKGCLQNEIDSILKPCSHVVLCRECVQNVVKCPVCFKIIEYFDKIYLPKIN